MGDEVLKHGASSADVVALQEALVGVGFDESRPDGVFGPRTETAVRALQEAMGLDVDGVAGEQTWAALRSMEPRGEDTPTLYRDPLHPWRRHLLSCTPDELPGS